MSRHNQLRNVRRDRLAESSERRFSLGDWMSAPEWITVREAAQLSGYHLEHVQRLLRQGKIKAEKRSGHDWWIDKSSLQEYVREMKKLGDEKFNPYRDKA